MIVTHTTAPKGQDEKVAEPKVAAPATEPVTAAEPEKPAIPEPKPKKPPASKKAAPRSKGSTTTLADLAAGYIKALEKDGRSPATCFSYAMELRTACSVLGEKTKLSALTPKKVGTFNECDRVTKLKSGREKSPLSISKSRRVLRLALCFAVEQGWLERAPLPEPVKPSN